MKRMGFAGIAVLVAAVLFADQAGAQEGPALPQQVISANPFGLLAEFFNAEYERVVSSSSTAGVGGSTIGFDNSRYLNADIFWRLYPGGEPLDGWAFGVKAGITSISDDDDRVDSGSDEGAYFGYGFDANRSWLLGESNNFYVGVGFGLKRLVGVDDGDEFDDAPALIPTIRIINIGYAF